jgi:hypothetical protein
MFASICIKTKYISQKHDNKPVCAGLWAWTAGEGADWFIVQEGKSAIFFGGGVVGSPSFFDRAVLME